MKTAIVLVLVVLAITLQGCIVSIGDSSTVREKPSETHESAVPATLTAMDSLPQEARIEVLRAIATSPLSEADYIAVIKAIEKVPNAEVRAQLLHAAVNARANAKSEPQKKPANCN